MQGARRPLSILGLALALHAGCYDSYFAVPDGDREVFRPVDDGRSDTRDRGGDTDADADADADADTDTDADADADDGGTCIPATEVCNGRDDDCDGATDEGGICPCAAHSHRGHSYLFCEPRTWYEGRRFCLEHGLDLASINDAEENEWAHGTAALYSTLQSWVGFTDEASEGNWIWVNGDPVTYVNWEAWEPSGGGENCGQINRFYPATTWNDEACTNVLWFVCESLGPVGDCGDGRCSAGETCAACPTDCGVCPDPCGDGLCADDESCATCPADCGACPAGCEPPAWNLTADFSATDNPNGPWQYGWAASDRADFTLSTAYGRDRMAGWAALFPGGFPGERFPYLICNRTGARIDYCGVVPYEPGECGLHPGPGGERSVVRWTAPCEGDIQVWARFYSKGTSTADVRIDHDGTVVHTAPSLLSESVYEAGLTVTHGSRFDFSLGTGGDGYGGDSSGIEISVRRVTWNLAREFSGECNPTGAWAFGATTRLGEFVPLPHHALSDFGSPVWWAGASYSDTVNIWKNTTLDEVHYGVDPGQVSMHPGCGPASGTDCGRHWAVVRWTSPFEGWIHVLGSFGAGDSGTMNETVALVDGAGASVLWERRGATGDEPFALRQEVRIGSHLDFVLGQDGWGSGNTPLDLTIRQIVPEP